MSPLDLSKDKDIVTIDSNKLSSSLSRADVTGDRVSMINDDDMDLVEKLLSGEQKMQLQKALKRAQSTPPVESHHTMSSSAASAADSKIDIKNIQKGALGRVHSENSSVLPCNEEFPMRKADSLENVSAAAIQEEKDDTIEDTDTKKFQKQLIALKDEINFFKTQNKELNKSLERSNTLLEDERRRRLSSAGRSYSSTSSLHESVSLDASSDGTQQVSPHRREQLRTISELNQNAGGLGGEEGWFRPRSSGGSFITEDEAQQRRKIYGQRKSSISLDEMYDLFGVHAKNISTTGATTTTTTPKIEPPKVTE